MYEYIAVTTGTLENCTDVLRISGNGIIEQYDIKTKKWRDADNGMSGIYSGDIECETIVKSECDTIIEKWLKNAN